MSNKKNEDQDMSRRDEKFRPASQYRARGDSGSMGGILSQLENSPGAAVLAYCFSSISMTVVNKYVVSGSSWNLNFLYLAIQVYSLFPFVLQIFSINILR
ncbi:uncharacterized protein ARB_03427 [Trichophyton benhamiae CBS 112371]|uniref:Uncharacterized protein n=1 Tax=Arthroderma benhamiae (strain ATCC MYA-4681 / CBS 112371) TaxID=663331 RepID=D4B4N7_ARTBC|nr:uncharacterized protein ARB_03427 [Trichophyton benhamiae CBS 112371]EFE30085.1 hypothetical protein ARB_03427 [Trichophyton benhamiae CBS 112371]